MGLRARGGSGSWQAARLVYTQTRENAKQDALDEKKSVSGQVVSFRRRIFYAGKGIIDCNFHMPHVKKIS